MLSKERGILKKVYNEIVDTIEELTKKNNYDGLNSIVENSGAETNLTKVEDPMVFLNNIKTSKVKLNEVKELQEDLNKLLQKIRKGNSKY